MIPFRVSIVLLVLSSLPQNSTACTVCHSKNPAMVRMHAALEYRDCFLCHGPAAKKAEGTPQERMLGDARCSRCHGGEKKQP